MAQKKERKKKTQITSWPYWPGAFLTFVFRINLGQKLFLKQLNYIQSKPKILDFSVV